MKINARIHEDVVPFIVTRNMSFVKVNFENDTHTFFEVFYNIFLLFYFMKYGHIYTLLLLVISA